MPTTPQRTCIRETNPAGPLPRRKPGKPGRHAFPPVPAPGHLASRPPPAGGLCPPSKSGLQEAAGTAARHTVHGEQGRPQGRCPAPRQAGTLYSRRQPCGLEKVSPVNPGLHRSQRSPCTCSLHTHWPVRGSQGAPGTAPSGSHSQAARQRRHQGGREEKQSIGSAFWFKFLSSLPHFLAYDLTTLVKLFKVPCASVCSSIKWG